MNRPLASHAGRWEGTLSGGCLALSLTLLPLACGGQTTTEAGGGGGSGTSGDTGSDGSGGGSNGDVATGGCDVLEEVLSEETSTPETTCEQATGLGFIAPDDWNVVEALVATNEGLWVAGYGDSGAFVSALSFDGEAEVLLAMADAGASALVLVGGDTLVVTGTISDDPEDATQRDIFLRRLTLDGDELWTARFDGDQGYAAALAPGPDESVYVAGTTYGELDGPTGGAFLRKYDAAGNLERDIELDASGSLSLEDMTATEEGALYVAVRTDTATSNVVRALNDDGEVLWELPASLLGCDFCRKLFVADDGDLYVVGSNNGEYGGNPDTGPQGDVSLARVSPGGEVLWTSIVSHPPGDNIDAVTVTEDGAYLFGHSFEGTHSKGDALAIHFGPDGEQLGLTTKDGFERTALLLAAASTPAGDVFVAGVGTPGFNRTGPTRFFVMSWPPAP